jgi:hypothetical protein
VIRVLGLGFRVRSLWVSRFGVTELGSGFTVNGLGGLGIRGFGSGLMVYGLEFRVWGFGF